MKKILIVSTRSPLPLFSGDRLRIFNISKYLSKNNKVDFIYTASKENFKKKIKFFDKVMFIETNVLKKFFYMIYFLIQGKPLQVGYFFSAEMKKKIEDIQLNYDCIIFHLIRASEYLPEQYNGKKILEMTDLISDNYFQLYKKLNFFNPLKYIYFIEKKLLESYEKRIINYFDCNILVSPNDLKVFKIENTLKKKIKIIGNGTELKKKVYKFKKSNKDIIFIGNINYLPNKIACFDFIKQIMPILRNKGYDINFKIIGRTSQSLKSKLEKFENVKVFTDVAYPEKLCKKAVCGISNLNIASGVQNKIYEYMNIGLPTIISQKCFKSLSFKKNSDLMVYSSQDEFIKQLIKLKTNEKFANKISKNCYNVIKKQHGWSNVLKKYNTFV